MFGVPVQFNESQLDEVLDNVSRDIFYLKQRINIEQKSDAKMVMESELYKLYAVYGELVFLKNHELKNL